MFMVPPWQKMSSKNRDKLLIFQQVAWFWKGLQVAENRGVLGPVFSIARLRLAAVLNPRRPN